MLEELKPLIKSSLVRKYSAGSTIIYQGEAPRLACILTEGVVRVFSISDQGDDQILAFHVAGEFFPSSWIFSKAPSSMFFYEAVTDCKVAYAPRKELTDFMMSNPERLESLVDYFTTSDAASLLRINALEQAKARDKLVRTLHFLCERYGTQKGETITIPLKLTHQNLASMVGLTRETTANEMSSLKRSKVISYDKQKYVVNKKKLLEIIGEDSFAGISIGSGS